MKRVTNHFGTVAAHAFGKPRKQPSRLPLLFGSFFCFGALFFFETPQAAAGSAVFDADGRIASELLSGVIRVRTLDGFERTETQYVLETVAGHRAPLAFYTPPHIETGDEIEARGTWTRDGVFSVESMRLLTRRPYRTDGPLARQPVHHRVAILAMEEASVTKEQVLEAFNGPGDSLARFYAEVSFGWDTFAGEIFRRYDIAYEPSNCLWNNAYDISDRLIAAFENEGHDASDFDHIAIIVPTSCGSDWDGAWADVGGIYDNGKLSFEFISMFKDDVVDPWFLAHELGHNLGMKHSRSVDCGDPLYAPEANGCSVREYGNYNDLMGSGEGVYFGAAYQRYLGWIDPASVVTANKSGTFNLHPSDSEMCGVRAVRIPIPDEEGAYFYLEYRHLRSDSRYAGIGDFGKQRRDAVILTVSRDGAGLWESSNVDRVEVGTSRYEGIPLGVPLDLGGGISVTAQSVEGPVARVFVEMPGSGAHRTDDGSKIFVAGDGSIGPLSCDDSEPDTDVDTGTGIDSDTEIDSDTDTGADTHDVSDTDFDSDTDTGADTHDISDTGLDSDTSAQADTHDGRDTSNDHISPGMDVVDDQGSELDTATPNGDTSAENDFEPANKPGGNTSSCRALVSADESRPSLLPTLSRLLR